MIKKILPKEDFNSLQDGIQFKKLTESIMDLKNHLNNDALSKLLERNNSLLADLINASKKTEYGPGIVDELKKNTEAILSTIKEDKVEVKQELKEWKFTVKRGVTGMIEEINAKQI